MGLAYRLALIPKNFTKMGEIKQGILGGFSGRVGTVVGSSWKNVSYMRALAISVSNPRTPKQQNQRGKFALCMNFLTSITPYVRTGYRLFAQDHTPFNAAMSYLLRHAITGSAPNLKVDYKRAMVARGSLMPVFNAVASSANGKVSFTWKDNSGQGDALGTDLAMPLVYNKVKGEAIYTLSAATRKDAKAELELPDSWADDALAVYLAFSNANATRMTNSVCLLDDAYEGESGGGNEGGGSDSGGGSDGGNDGDQGENPLG